tara:strand:+ start:724 stop:1455 length:732 start_codon:yes stop_codon:yes gene_type:complete
MSKHAKRPPLDVEIAPDGDRCRLSITMSWDALSELIEPVAHLVEPKQIAAKKYETERQEAQKRHKARHKQNLAEGLLILEAYEDYCAAGQSSQNAWISAANKTGHSVFNAQLFARMARREQKASRDQEIILLIEGGASIASIADRFGVTNSTIYRTLHRLKNREGAGEESGAFSGDRARSARRKALDASEAPQPLPQGSGQGKRSVASTPFPEPLPTGEVRGSGGKAPGKRGTRHENDRETSR